MMQIRKKNKRLPVPPVMYKDKIKLCKVRENLRKRREALLDGNYPCLLIQIFNYGIVIYTERERQRERL